MKSEFSGKLAASLAVILTLAPSSVNFSTNAVREFIPVAQAATPARARQRLEDYKKIKQAYHQRRDQTSLEALKSPRTGLHDWYGKEIAVLSTHDINRKKNIYHRYNIFIWQNIGKHAYLVVAGKKLGRNEKLHLQNACKKTTIKNLKHFQSARFSPHESDCQTISVREFEEYNCRAERYCKKNLALDRYRKNNKYLFLTRIN